jgi:hypothetical protein
MTDHVSGTARSLAECLVGPAGPEVSCEECFETLDTYVELELAGVDAGAEAPKMLAHLQGCSACRSDHDGLLALVHSDPQDVR